MRDRRCQRHRQCPAGRAIDQILTRQAPNGGFGLWSPGSGDPWLESPVTDFLSRARVAGYQVPDNALSKQAIDNLRNRANYATEPQNARPMKRGGWPMR